ncbi:hypothetical protein [Limnobacter sp.]|uniref:hypothetical protein n=1 Tax=Limnobacter sp. TaxID=2003368 RepID=UPI0025B88DAE|nr:hypothetical protein [Limnobacter sp.]
MALSAREALAHVKHALSSDQMPSVGGLRILNDAGELLVNMHSWRWLEGVQVDVDLHADQPYVWLPENVREITALVATSTLNTAITLTTPMELAQRRASTVSTSFHYWGALVFAPKSTPREQRCTVSATPATNGSDGLLIRDGSQSVSFLIRNTVVPNTDTIRAVLHSTDRDVMAQRMVAAINDDNSLGVRAEYRNDGTGRFYVIGKFDGPADQDYFSVSQVSGAAQPLVQASYDGQQGGAPTPRLDLWPTPGSFEQDAFKAYYRAGWTPIRTDNDTVNVPSYIEPLYIQIVRAVALGYERDAEADVNVRVAQVRAGTVFSDARTRDGLTQPTLGPIENGAVQHDYGINQALWNFDSTGGPS